MLKEEKDCDLIQLQFILPANEDNEYSACFYNNAGAKYSYARIRFIKNARSIQYFN